MTNEKTPEMMLPTIEETPELPTFFKSSHFTEREMFKLKAKFHAKKLNVMKEVSRVPKNGWNNFHKYAYTTESDLTESIRPLLYENSLAFDCEITDSAKGGNDITEVTMAMTLTDVETGYSETKLFKAEGQDKGDKGYYKAFTGAVKYFLMKTFLIPTGDDPELTEDNKYQTPSGSSNTKPPKATDKQIGAVNGKVAELVKLGKKKNDIIAILNNKCGDFESIETMSKSVAMKSIDYLNQWIENAKGNK
jgi:hypothetical protein